MNKLSLTKQILSYLYPIKVASAKGISTPIISLYKYVNRWQLSSETALYSDGNAYRPLLLAFKYLGQRLNGMNQMLVLGAGLGSAVAIMHRLEYKFTSTLVDIDPQIIEWGKAIVESETKYPCIWELSDAQIYLEKTVELFDLIIIDIFQDRIVPSFVLKEPFLGLCMERLKDHKSMAVLNYIVHKEEYWVEDLKRIRNAFEIEKVISLGINKVLILKKNV